MLSISNVNEMNGMLKVTKRHCNTNSFRLRLSSNLGHLTLTPGAPKKSGYQEKNTAQTGCNSDIRYFHTPKRFFHKSTERKQGHKGSQAVFLTL